MKNSNEIAARRNWVTLGFLVLLGLSLIYSYKIAGEQEALFQQDRVFYYSAMDAAQKNDFPRALELMQHVSPYFQKSWLYIYSLGHVQFSAGQWEQANINMQKAEDIRPNFLSNPDYLIIRASIFVKIKDKESALLYLEHARQIAQSDTQNTQIDTLYISARELP